MDFDAYSAEFKKLYPDASEKEIKAHFDLNIGRDMFERVASSAARGMGMLGTSVGTAIEMLGGDQFGSMVNDYWEQVIRENPKDPALSDITQDPSIMLDSAYWAENLPEVAMSQIPTYALGGAGFKAAKMLGAGTKGAAATGMLGGGVAGGHMEGASTYRQSLEKGLSDDEAMDNYWQMMAGTGALNALPLGAAFSRIGGAGLGGLAARSMLGGAGEAVTESLEEPLEATILGDDPMEAWMTQGINVMPPAFLMGGVNTAITDRGLQAQKMFQQPPQVRQPIPEQRPLVYSQKQTDPRWLEQGGTTHFQNIQRNKRVTGTGELTESDKGILGTMPKEEANEAGKAIQGVRKRYPVEEGWAPINVTGVEKNSKGNWVPKVQQVKASYHLDPTTGKATKATEPYRINALASKVASDIQQINERAKSGDKHAQTIMRNAQWYHNMRMRLREAFGGMGDLFADLLGAYSPQEAVAQNFDYAIEAIQNVVNGKYDKQLAELKAHLDSGKSLGSYKGSTALKNNGKNFGINTNNGMLAMLDMWNIIQSGQAPKARNFSGNLIGRTEQATVDIWAARYMQRLAGLQRIAPAADGAPSGSRLKDPSQVGGSYGFAAKVFEQAGQQLGMRPDDLQAVAWFAEKELWTKNNWTSVQGEGGSFEGQMDKAGLERTLAGVTVQQQEAPSDADMQEGSEFITRSLQDNPEVIAFKSPASVGLYAGDVERTYDLEVTHTPNYDETQLISDLAELAKANNQFDVFVSHVLPLDHNNPNARPAIEIYFRDAQSMEQVKPLLDEMVAKGQDGFTLVVDPRATTGGEQAQEFVGVRLQYVPEIQMRWDDDFRAAVKQNPAIIDEIIEQKRDELFDLAAQLSENENVSLAQSYDYDTITLGKENYDDFIQTEAAGRTEPSHQKARFGQPVREAVAAAADRLDGTTDLENYYWQGSQQEVAPQIYNQWHGSPHDTPITEFDDEKIGSGEGGGTHPDMYEGLAGWGHYVADKKGVAEWYRDMANLSGHSYTYKGKKVKPLTNGQYNDILWMRKDPSAFNLTYEDAAAMLLIHDGDVGSGVVDNVTKRLSEESINAQIARLKEGNYNDYEIPSGASVRHLIKHMTQMRDMITDVDLSTIKATKGRLYEVELLPKDDEWLLWDEPLSKQSEKVLNALINDPNVHNGLASVLKNKDSLNYYTGKNVYQSLTSEVFGSARATSEYLLSLGIKGNKFLDGSSRGKGEGSYNYVVFQGQDIKIKSYEMSNEAFIAAEKSAEREATFAMPFEAPITPLPEGDVWNYTRDLPEGRHGEQIKRLIDGGKALGLTEPLVRGGKNPYRFAISAGVHAPTRKEAAAIQRVMQDMINENLIPEHVLDMVDAMFVHNNSDAGLAMFVPAQLGVPNSLGFDATMLGNYIDTNDAALAAEIRLTMAHELGHAIDIGANGRSATWESPLFHFDPFGVSFKENPKKQMGVEIKISRRGNTDAMGGIFREVVNLMNSKRGWDSGLGRFLMYPLADLNHVVLGGKSIEVVIPHGVRGRLETFDVNADFAKNHPEVAEGILRSGLRTEVRRIQAEIFAQLNGLYYTRPAMLKKYLPQSYKLMQEVHNNVKHRTDPVSVSAGVRDALRSPDNAARPAGEQPQGRDPFAQGVGDSYPSWQADQGVRTVRGGSGSAQRPTAFQSRVQGRPVDTNSPEFRQWFGDSKVVDENGKPLVVYHGTRKSGFSEFSRDMIGSNSQNAEHGFYFTGEIGASTYSGTKSFVNPINKKGESGIIAGNYPVYLSMQKPYVVDFENHNWDGADEYGDYHDDHESVPEVEEMARELGYDGVIIYNVKDEGRFGEGYMWDTTTYIIFEPNKIKSAISNEGGFTESPNIYKQEAPHVSQRVDEVGGWQATEEARRGVRPREATRQAAEALGTTPERLDAILRRAYGRPYNAEEVFNAAQMLEQQWKPVAEELYAINVRIEEGRASDQDLARAEELILELQPLAAQFMGVRAEAGRTLEIFKAAQDTVGVAKALTNQLGEFGGRDMLKARIALLSNINNPVDGIQAAGETHQITRMDQLIEYYKAMLLTGVPTHVVNMVSNAGMQVLNDVDYMFASVIGMFTGSKDRVTLGEFKERLAAYNEGTRLGLSALYEGTMDEDATYEDLHLERGLTKVEQRHPHAISGLKGKVVRIPFRMLGAFDMFYKGIAFAKSIRGQAQRLKNAGDPRSIADIVKNPTPEMLQEANDEAAYLTFTNQGGDFTQWIKAGAYKHPLLQVLIPFINTPANIVKVALKHSPAAVFWTDVRNDIAQGGRKRDLAIGRIATGSSIGAMAVGLAAAGVLTGQPPEDPNERRMWLQNHQPNSIRVGDQWISYSRLEPFGMLLGIAADMQMFSDRMTVDEPEELASLVISSITSNLTSKTYLRGLTEFVAMVNDPERYGDRWLKRMGATMAVPVFFSYTAKATDDRLRQAESMLDHIKARLPVLRNTLPERLDTFGQPIMEEGTPLYRFLSPAYLKRAKDDVVAKEIIATEASMPRPSRKLEGVELSPKQYNSLTEALGKPTYSILKRVVRSKAYKQAPLPLKQWILDKIIANVRNDARRYWKSVHPEIMAEARRLKREKWRLH